MWRFLLVQAARLALGLVGTVLLAACVAALSEPGARAGAAGYFSALVAQLGAYARLDFGTSIISAMPAANELAQRLPVTLELVGLGAIVALLLGGPLGILLGTERPLRAAAPLIQIVAATPVFVASLALLWAAANLLHWPGMEHIGEPELSAFGVHGDFDSTLRALALPVLTVGAAGAAAVQLGLRRAAAEAMDEPYRRGLRLMGLSTLEINSVYLVPQVLTGLLLSLGDIALALFAAAAVAEWVFAWPGAAVLFLKSVALHDWSVAALVLFVFAAIKLAADFTGELGAYALSGRSAAS
jgi:peptide/nickel transport system permease protein